MSSEANNKQIPSIRSTQFEVNGNDIFKDSVNLFRGDVNLALDLVSLQGRNGLDFKVTASYGSNVKNTINVSNVEKPTGIIGLGWTLPFQRIEVETLDNATSNDILNLINHIKEEIDRREGINLETEIRMVGDF